MREKETTPRMKRSLLIRLACLSLVGLSLSGCAFRFNPLGHGADPMPEAQMREELARLDDPQPVNAVRTLPVSGPVQSEAIAPIKSAEPMALQPTSQPLSDLTAQAFHQTSDQNQPIITIGERRDAPRQYASLTDDGMADDEMIAAQAWLADNLGDNGAPQTPAMAAYAQGSDEDRANDGRMAMAPQPLSNSERANIGTALPDSAWVDDQRRRPGGRDTQERDNQLNPGAVPPPLPNTYAGAGIPVPDRWRLVEALGVNEKWWDPYNQNTLKGDRPIWGGDEWFFIASAISDTVIEPRSFPLPVGVQTTTNPDSLDVFGKADSFVAAQTFILSAALVKGSTAYKPQDLEFRIAAAFNYNYADVEEKRVLFVQPSKGTSRRDGWIGLQEAFVDYHIRNVSERYDFDSLRVGIQPFSTDFRGFLFQDNQLGIRFFGNRDNNRFQYNLAAFARLEKDTNSGLNDVTRPVRQDYMLVANAYRQDLPFPGMTSQLSLVGNFNREKNNIQIDDNGFPVRPALLGNLRGREYDVGYIGYNADGRVGRVNLTASTYYAFGQNRNSIFTGEKSNISAFFAAVEPSVDYDWMRFRLSALYASGDDDPYDNTEKGFDAIFENPQFAGADTSYWIRQTFPYAGGGRVIGLNGRNGILNSLRSSKEQGQSNFTNPGTVLLGAGADFDITPPLRISVNANHLWFDKTEVLEALRIQGPIDNDIGWDVSTAAIYRPGFIQNFVFRLSGAALIPGEGFKDIYDNVDDEDYYYSVLFNGIVSY